MVLRRHFTFRIAAAFVLLAGVGRLAFPPLLSSGDNMEAVVSGGTEITDRAWDRRYYDGTAGWDGFVEWRYNDSGRPFSTKAAVETMIQAGYDAWSAMNGTLGLGTPLVPVWQQGTDTTVTDAGALDGINAIVWFTGSPGGVLASAPCTSLTTPATTVDDGAGNAVIAFGAPIGDVPVPGPVGAAYAAGTVIDCGVKIDDQENWVDGAGGAGTIDFLSVMTHEEGHTNSVSHSTVGETTATAADEATMSPFVFGNNTDYRTLAEDDVASIVRFLSRFNSLPLTTGGRGVITGVLKEGGSCDTATGVSARAYLGTVEGSNTVETFSRSQFRTGSDDGRFEVNVMEGGPYTIYARQFERAGSGFYLKGRYNVTTNNSNFTKPPGQSTPLDGLATVDWVAAGQTIDIGDVGVLGCVACNSLTRTHSGSGGNPSANPTSSSGCSTGTYHSGEQIQLTASPSPGWQVGSWTGTSNDGSTSTSNTLTMPSGPHATAVHYALISVIPQDLVLSNDTISQPGLFEACNSITLGPGLFITAGAPGVTLRAPTILFVPESGALAGALVTFHSSVPVGCP